MDIEASKIQNPIKNYFISEEEEPNRQNTEEEEKKNDEKTMETEKIKLMKLMMLVIGARTRKLQQNFNRRKIAGRPQNKIAVTFSNGKN